MDATPRRRHSPAPGGAAEPRFVADVMLGKLARWLRLLGFDVAYSNRWDDRTIARRAALEGRIVLSRDTGLLARRIVRRGYLVRSADWREQLAEVIDRFGLRLDRTRFFSRCSRCNVPVVPAPRAEVRERVPDHIFRTVRRFARCPSCGRVYWGGSHRGEVLAAVRALGRDAAGEADLAPGRDRE